MPGSIQVKIVKETAKSVTVKLLSVNRNMPVPKAEFEKRLKNGTYKVVD